MRNLAKYSIILCFTFSISFTLFADKDLGMAKVTAIKKVGNIDYTPDTNTAKGMLIGAGTGAAAGAVFGVISEGGLIIATSPTIIGPVAVVASTPFIIGVPTLLGTGIGAVIGTGSGYVWGLHKKGLGVFKITVQPDKPNSKPVTLHQNLKNNITLGEHVELMENDILWFVPDGNYIIPKGIFF